MRRILIDSRDALWSLVLLGFPSCLGVIGPEFGPKLSPAQRSGRRVEIANARQTGISFYPL